jgi:hypothetical protein
MTISYAAKDSKMTKVRPNPYVYFFQSFQLDGFRGAPVLDIADNFRYLFLQVFGDLCACYDTSDSFKYSLVLPFGQPILVGGICGCQLSMYPLDVAVRAKLGR